MYGAANKRDELEPSHGFCPEVEVATNVQVYFCDPRSLAARKLRLLGPPGMAPSVVSKFNKVLNEIINEEKLHTRLTAAGVAIHGSTAAEFGAFIVDEYDRCDAVRQSAGIARP